MRARLAGRAAHPREAAFGFPRSRPPSSEPGVDSQGLLLTWAPGSFLCVGWDLGSYTDKASKAGPVQTPTSAGALRAHRERTAPPVTARAQLPGSARPLGCLPLPRALSP